MWVEQDGHTDWTAIRRDKCVVSCDVDVVGRQSIAAPDKDGKGPCAGTAHSAVSDFQGECAVLEIAGQLVCKARNKTCVTQSQARWQGATDQSDCDSVPWISVGVLQLYASDQAAIKELCYLSGRGDPGGSILSSDCDGECAICQSIYLCADPGVCTYGKLAFNISADFLGHTLYCYCGLGHTCQDAGLLYLHACR